MSESADNSNTPRPVSGRGSSLRGRGRFEKVQLVTDWDQVNDPELAETLGSKVPTEYLTDDSESIISQNNSPDVYFNYSLNPYRGCVHGCSYCYARPSHEFLGFNAGLDFESKIVVKEDAPELFRKWLARRSWANQVEPIMLSGVTDCYQPCEKELQLTRRCLEIALQAKQPIFLTTKNALIRRDVDIISEMAKLNLIFVTLSITTLNQSLTRIMEPRSSSPAARLDALKQLSDANVPTKVLVAPVIPAINDDEIPAILERTAQYGATHAGYIVLRLPLSVEPVFLNWLEQHFPDRVDKIVGRIQSLRQGKMYDSDFSQRMKGTGFWADQISNLFKTCCLKHNLKREPPPLVCTLFEPPDKNGNQKRLF